MHHSEFAATLVWMLESKVSRLSSRAVGVWTATIALALFGPTFLRAQNTSGDNPTGYAGDFNGDVTTAGQYDPYTANVKRVVTDLVVPGSNGAYPLAFTRTFNANVEAVGNDAQYFGDGLNWRHSYQWSMNYATYNNTGVTGWIINYPSGSSVVYTAPNASLYPSETFWRGPAGTTDRLETQTSGNGTTYILHTSDGGKVYFANSTRATSIVDPNGATTTLTYATTGGIYSTPPIGYLTQVTEPGGRTLSFTYREYTKDEYTNGGTQGIRAYWFLLDTVTASTGQSVSYQYTMVGNNENSLNSPAPYEALTSVTYNDEASVNGGGVLTATYGVSTTPAPADLPQLANAADPHFAGAMNHIQYAYSSTPGTYTLEEQNFLGQPGEMVSHCHLVDSTGGNPTVSTEIRGDHASGGGGISRTFTYGQTSAGPISSTNAQPYDLTSVTDFQGNTSYLGYDRTGYVNQRVDRCGFTTQSENYPNSGKAYQVTLPYGYTRTYVWTDQTDTVSGSYTTQANPYYLHEVIDERGNTTIYSHDSTTGLVTGIAHPDGGVESFTYTALSSGTSPAFYKLNSHTTVLGAIIYYFYDQSGHGGSGKKGLLTSVLRNYADGYGNAPQETTNFYYDSFDRINKVVDPRGVTGAYTYNARHELLSVTHLADNTSQVYTYNDDFGWRTSVKDELGHTTTTSYDEYGRPTSLTQPVNAGGITTRTTYTTYDGRDNNNAVIADALSHTSSQVSYQVAPSGRGIQHIYSPNGWLTDEYSGRTTGNPGTSGSLSFSQCLHTKQNITYDAMGRQATITDAQGELWHTAVDGLGRPIIAADPLGHATSTTYFPAGNANAGLVQTKSTPGNATGTNPPALVTTYNSYDAMGRATKWTDSAGVAFTSGYDTNGDLTSLTDGNTANPATSYAYDQLGRKYNLGYADGTNEQWHYDASGNLSSYKNRAGNVETFSAYDLRNRPTNWSWTNTNPPSSTTFDAAGRCTSLNNTYVVLNMTYDDSNALLTEQQCINGNTSNATVSYTPDADGNVYSIQYPHGDIGFWANRDYLNRITEVDANLVGLGNTQLTTCGYSNAQLQYRMTNAQVVSAYGYQANNRINVVSLYHNANGANISYRNYGYYPDGQLSWFNRNNDGGQSGSTFENGNGDAYYYYANGRFENGDTYAAGVYAAANAAGDSSPGTPSNPARTESYVYDNAGNRTYDQETTVVRTPTYDGENRRSGFSYDANGNVTSVPFGSGSTVCTYDALNQLVSASCQGNTASFVYDGKGRLCQRTINGAPTNLYYAGDKIVEETNGSNGKTCTYYYGEAGQRACRVTAANSEAFYHYDGLGILTHLTNSSGTVIEQYMYTAYGTPLIYDATGTQSRNQTSTVLGQNRSVWLQGYEWYPELGLYRCGARFYEPYYGSFMQPDPIRQSGGLNIYSYCQSDPVNCSDPRGMGPISPIDVVVNHSVGLVGDLGWAFDSTGQASYNEETGTYQAIYARSETLWTNTNPTTSNRVVGLMWGFGGDSQREGYSNHQIFALAEKLAVEGIGVIVGDWTQGDGITQFIEGAVAGGATDVRIAGYSLGGPAAINVANALEGEGIHVRQVDTIDPVLPFGGNLSAPEGVDGVANRYQSNGGAEGIVPGFFGNFRGTPVNGAIPNFDVRSIQPNINHQSMPFYTAVFVQTFIDLSSGW